ncbi:MAG: hypothetical protein DSY91_00400 [Deltaproteobacteria bacterium]|nr:MAG: hypothetical protein DSY91_00400 [Deltaproteobacteria bacterium]
MESKPDLRKGYGLVVAGGVALGMLGVVGRILYTEIDSPVTLVQYRAFFGTVVLFAVLAVFARSHLRINPRHVPFFALYGLLSIGLNSFCYFSAIQKIGISLAVVLLYTYPVFLMILSIFFLKEPLTGIKVFALLLSVTGVMFLVTHGGLWGNLTSRSGIFYGLGAGFFSALYSLFGKKALVRYQPATVLFYALLFGSLFFLVWGLATGQLQTRFSSKAWFWLFVLGVGPSLLGYFLYTMGLKYVEASRAGIVATVEVLAAVLGAFLFFDERMTAKQILGGIMVLSGAVAVQWEEMNPYRRKGGEVSSK